MTTRADAVFVIVTLDAHLAGAVARLMPSTSEWRQP
jgi:hypothetical protein